jgi:hypothetical protein
VRYTILRPSISALITLLPFHFEGIRRQTILFSITTFKQVNMKFQGTLPLLAITGAVFAAAGQNSTIQQDGPIGPAIKDISVAISHLEWSISISDFSTISVGITEIDAKIEAGLKAIDNSAKFSYYEADRISIEAQALQTNISTLVDDLIGKRSWIDNIGRTSRLKESLLHLLNSVNQISTMVASQAPPEIAGYMQKLFIGASSTLQRGIDFYNAPSTTITSTWASSTISSSSTPVSSGTIGTGCANPTPSPPSNTGGSPIDEGLSTMISGLSTLKGTISFDSQNRQQFIDQSNAAMRDVEKGNKRIRQSTCVDTTSAMRIQTQIQTLQARVQSVTCALDAQMNQLTQSGQAALVASVLQSLSTNIDDIRRVIARKVPFQIEPFTSDWYYEIQQSLTPAINTWKGFPQ